MVESGTFDVFVAKPGSEPVKVTSYSAGAAFGELALMYNAPRYGQDTGSGALYCSGCGSCSCLLLRFVCLRVVAAGSAATVKATSDAVCWALERKSFRRILLSTTLAKRRMYEEFLEEVPLLKELEPYERHKIADALQPATFEDGHVIIKQGYRGKRGSFG